jgi:acetylornithine deacetylase/succinyl-diaminopimelate desuccinylase-like protein
MQVFFGAWGITDVELTVYGPLRPLHSGHYGNWAGNPALTLAHLLAGLKDLDGRIRIAGFYDEVRPPTPAEASALAELLDVEAALRHELALRPRAGGRRWPSASCSPP